MKKALLSLIALGTLGTTSLASAQDIQGAFQLGLGTSFLSYTKASVTVGEGAFETDLDTSTTHWGLSDSGGIQVEGGYGITDSLVIGGLFALGGESSTTETEGNNDVDSSEFNLLLAPKIDYHFSAGQPVQPFVGGAIGLVVANASEGDVDTSAMGLGILGRGGVRWFLAQGFSLDPALNLGFQTISGDIDAGAAETDLSGIGYSIGLSIGMSGWVK